jgi:dTDP-4-amino-4,6-dideoxygalactose transaminase
LYFKKSRVDEVINVTKTFLPPFEEYEKFLYQIWKTKHITNNGPLHDQHIDKLKNYLNLNHIITTANGTLPLQLALNLFGNCGEIITTPFSYVATTAAIVWEKCKPVFVDIDPEYLTIDENKIEEAINEKTTAILATHVYGNICNVEQIDLIAKKYNLKVIYDAAHCFGVEYKDKSIFDYGDISTCSFHGTKIYHTGEGGAIFCKDEKNYKELNYRHNFGHMNQQDFHGLGINAKMSELQAALGLSIFPYIDSIIDERKTICEFYNNNLSFNFYSEIAIRKGLKWNYAYYPILFESENQLLIVKSNLEKGNIFPRRYFYPSLEELPYIDSDSCSIAKSIASRVLCLPLYVGLRVNELKKIVNIINQSISL